jgi:hypothetical protein
LGYQWRFNGAPLPGATNDTLSLSSAAPELAGAYSVVVANPFGTVTSPAATLEVLSGVAPVITSPPQNLAVDAGATATFTVTVTGTPPMAYQWRFKGADLPGATGAVLTLPNVQPGQAGAYVVAVWNAFGAVTSPKATLTINDALTLGLALEVPAGSWITDSPAGWFAQTQVTHDGTDAAQSGRIAHDQKSTLETTFTGPGTVSFWWKVSSEPDWDALEFRVDGKAKDRLSGEQDWRLLSLDLAAGTHTLQWVYAKDGSDSGGQDTAWLDEVRLGTVALRLLALPMTRPGVLALRLEGTPNQPYRVETTTDLQHWNRWTNGVPATGILELEDTLSPGRPMQFYRAVQE